MRLAVSNIAFKGDDLAASLGFVRELGFEGVELAASLLWPEPVDASAGQRNDVRSRIQGEGLATVGLHALFFTRPDLALFDTEARRQAARDYLRRLFELCRDLGGRTLVFGSPSARRRGALGPQEALETVAGFFRRCAEDASGFGVYLLIEPLTPQETDFILSSDEGAALVRRVDHEHFRLELDARVMAESREDFDCFRRHRDILMHVQTSDPGLTEPGSTGLDHTPFGAALQRARYDGWLSLEMRRPPSDVRGALRRSFETLRRCYLEAVPV